MTYESSYAAANFGLGTDIIGASPTLTGLHPKTRVYVSLFVCGHIP